MKVRLHLGWDLSGRRPIKPKLEPSLQEAIEQLIGKVAVPYRNWYELDCIHCNMCNTEYIVQECWQETSNSAYRVQITDIARLL